jgi:hypothetical protein
MRVFLVQTAHGLNAPSGGYRSNLGFIRQLGGYGHTVAQTCYAWDDEVEAGVANAKAKGVNPEVQRLPSVDLGKDPKTGVKRRLRVTKFIDENRILNIVISRALWELYPYTEQVADHRAYLEVITLASFTTSRMGSLFDTDPFSVYSVTLRAPDWQLSSTCGRARSQTSSPPMLSSTMVSP